MLNFLNDPSKLHLIVGYYLIGLIVIGITYGIAKEGKDFFRNFL